MKPSESRAFERFCAIKGLVPSDFKSPDPPDFVKTDDTLAIELVEYHHDPGPKGSLRRQAESEIRRAVGKAREAFAQQTKRRTDVFLYFRDDRAPPKDVMDLLVRFVVERPGQDLRLEWNTMPDWMRPHFEMVSMGPTADVSEEMLWQAPEVGDLDVSTDAVQVLLDGKRQKVDEYRTHAPEIWLVVHSGTWPTVGDLEGGFPATCAQIDSALRERTFQSAFDRVFFLDQGRGEMQELRIRKPDGVVPASRG